MSEDFDWDDANLKHIARHEVSPEEAEQVLLNDPLGLDFHEVDGEERFVVVGMTARARCLVVVWTPRGKAIRVVTAFDAEGSYERLYFSAKGA